MTTRRKLFQAALLAPLAKSLPVAAPQENGLTLAQLLKARDIIKSAAPTTSGVDFIPIHFASDFAHVWNDRIKERVAGATFPRNEGRTQKPLPRWIFDD